MKRVRIFDLSFQPRPLLESHTADDLVRYKSTRLLKVINAPVQTSDGWHETCEMVQQRLASEDSCQAIVFDSIAKRVVAQFSSENLSLVETPANLLETEEFEADSLPCRQAWSSLPLNTEGADLVYENRNVRDFFWDQIEGARRDVPFRLGYFERLAERHQVFAYPLGLVREWQDMFGRKI